MLLPHASFQELINQDNQTILLLHSHWIALSQIMVLITDQEHAVRAKEPRHSPTDGHSPQSQQLQQGGQDNNPGFHRWLRHLNGMVDYEHQMYNQWPMWVEEQLQKDAGFFGKSMRP